MSEIWACAKAPGDRRGPGPSPEAPVFSCYTQTGDHLQSGSTSSWIIKPVWSERWWRKWMCGGCELCIGLWFRECSSFCETDALNVFTSYKKTSETLSTAGQKTSAAFSTLSSTISRKFEDMRYAVQLFLCTSQDAQSSFRPLLVSLFVYWFLLGNSGITKSCMKTQSVRGLVSLPLYAFCSASLCWERWCRAWMTEIVHQYLSYQNLNVFWCEWRCRSGGYARCTLGDDQRIYK